MTIGPLPPVTAPASIGAPSRTAAAAAPGAGDGFSAKVAGALDALAQSHAEVDVLAQQAATGDLTAVHDYTIAASEAQLLTELTVEVRNRAIEAFNDIMRMQV